MGQIDFVYRSKPWGYFLLYPSRVLTEGQEYRSVKKLVDLRPFQAVLNKKGLACLARSEEKMGFFLQERGQLQEPLDIWDIFASIICHIHRRVS
jgi:hypothetical protein